MSNPPLQMSSGYAQAYDSSFTLLLDFDRFRGGIPSPAVRKAVRHVCGLHRPQDGVKGLRPHEFRQKAREYFHHFKQHEADEIQAHLFVWFVAVYFHELRHAHDLLSLSYGQYQFWAELAAYQNVYVLVRELHQWQKRTGPAIPVGLAANAGELKNLPPTVLKCIEHYERVQKVRADLRADVEILPGRARLSSPARLRATYLFEACAVTIQHGLIETIFGAEEADKVERLVLGAKGGHNDLVYTQLRDELREYFVDRDYHEGYIPTIINHLCWTALQGTWPQGKRAETGTAPQWQRDVRSTTLYEAFVEKLTSEGELPLDLKIIDTKIEELCRLWRLTNPRASIDYQTLHLQNYISWRTEYAKAVGTRDLLGPAYAKIAQAYGPLCNLITSSAEVYHDPEFYLDSLLSGAWPSVPVHVNDGKSTDQFMSPGYTILNVDDWNLLFLFSTAFSLIMRGWQGKKENLNPLETIVLKQLEDGSFAQSPLRFADSRIASRSLWEKLKSK